MYQIVSATPKISIIMGIYNCESTLEECLNSIINQTYTNWEVIMCDDCSKDNTYLIAKRYEEKFKGKIKVIRNKKNIKLAATLNKCLQYSTGDYIARVDSDDICMENRFERQVGFLEENKEYDLVGSQMLVFSDDKILGKKSIPEYPNKYTQRYSNPFAHPTVLVRKKVFDRLGGYSTSERNKRCEDVELWFRFYENNFKGYNIQEALYMYREDAKSLKKRKFKDAIDCACVYYSGFKKLKYPKKYYIYILKPIIANIIPKKVLQMYQIINGKRER